jgi:Tol biopolymer transport system component
MPQAGTCRAADSKQRKIVASRRGRIVLLRPSDGKEICTLVNIEQARDTIITLSLTPDGRTVYFAESGFARCSRVFAAEIRTGRVAAVVDGGYAPEVSPDGRYLAYNASYSCGDRRHRIVVLDLKSGHEREWLGTWSLGYGDGIVWAPNPRYLIVTKAGTDSARDFLFDTTGSGPLDGPPWPPIDDRRAPRVAGRRLSALGVTLGGATVRPKMKTVLFGVWYSEETPDEKHPILEFDPSSDTFRVLIKDAGGPIDFDPSGKHLLYRGIGPGLPLFRFSGGRSVRLGHGYWDAAW